MPKHMFLIRGKKGAGKSSLSLTFADRAAELEAKLFFLDVDTTHNGQIMDRLTPERRALVDRIAINKVDDLANALNTYDKNKHPVVVFDGISNLQKLVMDYTRQFDFETMEPRSGNGHVINVKEVMRKSASQAELAASSRLQYAFYDALKGLDAEFVILTQQSVKMKGDSTYYKGIPFTEFDCDGVFNVWKDASGYKLKVADVKFGEPGKLIPNPSYSKLTEAYPQMAPRRVAVTEAPRKVAGQGQARL